jgi:hypothetical protein
MQMFGLFKKKQPQPQKEQPQPRTGPFASLEHAITLLPQFYRTEPAFSECLRLVANDDPQAVESLIALTNVDGHHFSDQFWREVEACASMLALQEQVAYCQQQIERNAKELPQKLQPGWTMYKTGPSTYQTQIAQSVWDAWDEARRTKHNVSKLLKKNGFHMVQDGREGTLYYVNNGRLMEFYVELSGNPEYSIIVSFSRVNGYVLPARVKITDDEKQRLKADLQAWLRRNGYRALVS